MPIETAQGELIIQGIVHGAALNCVKVLYSDPSDWEMVQFVSQLQLDQYARDHGLAVIIQEKK